MSAEHRVRYEIGNLMIERAVLAARVEELEKKLAELEQPKPAESS
jgi:hypothetical protein